MHLTSQVLESSNHEQGPFLTFLGFSGSTHQPHEIWNSRATLDLFKWIFWGLLGKVLRIIHTNFREVSLRIEPVLVRFLECLRAVFRFSTHLPHEICNSRASLDLLELIFWDLLGKVLRIVHANFHEVSLRFDLVSIVFRRGVGLFSARSFSENWQY